MVAPVAMPTLSGVVAKLNSNRLHNTGHVCWAQNTSQAVPVLLRLSHINQHISHQWGELVYQALHQRLPQEKST